MCVDTRGLFKFWWIYQTCPVFLLIFGPAAKFVGSQFPNQGWNLQGWTLQWKRRV